MRNRASSSPRPSVSRGSGQTVESRIAGAFGLRGESWMRHANPLSVWTRFAVLPLLAISIWSRDWIGWWSLIPILLSLVFMVVNPLLFPRPRSTKSWGSKGVLGERIWAERNTVEIPHQFTPAVPIVTYAFQTVGMALLGYGLIVLDTRDVIAGIVLVQCAKAWFIDRMVLLFEDMKARRPDFAEWEY
jgi:uncharacterized protein DUF6653